MDQKKIADNLVGILVSSGEFTKVELVGSLCGNQYDDMSDIDIVVSNIERSYFDNVKIASCIMHESIDVIMIDWVGSLLPEKCVMNLFHANVPLFWWIDIGCVATEKFPYINRMDLQTNYNDHIAKLWVMNAKYFLRGDRDKLKLAHLYERVFPEIELPDRPIRMFADIYRRIDFAAIKPAFEEGCRQIYDILLDRE